MGRSFHLGPWTVEPDQNTVSRDGRAVHLEPKPMEVLVRLAASAGETISKDEIIRSVWPDTFVGDDALSGAIYELRKALQDDPHQPQIIQTIPKRGYRLIAPVQRKPLVATTEQITPIAVLRLANVSGDLQRKRRNLPLLVGAAVLAAVVIAALVSIVWRYTYTGRHASALVSATRLSLTLPPGQLASEWGDIAISPDGQTLVYSARLEGGEHRLYTRHLDEWEANEFPGIHGWAPFFSPDGQWIGFSTEKGLLKIPLRGGPPQTICQERCVQSAGASWGQDGRIVFANWAGKPGLLRVNSDGGTPETLLAADADERAIPMSPELLPGARAVLFTAWHSGQASIVAVSLDSGEKRTVIASGSQPRYLSTGHLLYVSEGQLKAVPFDAGRLAVLGPARVLADGVNDNPQGISYAVSENGVVAISRASASGSKLVWKDRNGATTPLALNPRDYSFPELSPDGRRLAVTVQQGPVRNILVGSVEREPLAQVTFSNDDVFSVWSPDSQRIAYTSGSEGGRWNVYWTLADGSGKPERLTDSPHPERPTSFSPKGETLLLNAVVGAGNAIDVYDLSLRGRVLRPFLNTRFHEIQAAFSPDGRWVTYASDESGRFEVYVRTYPGGGAKQQISVDGGKGPLWNANGRELFYETGTAIMAVPISVDGQTLRPGKPIKLFPHLTEGWNRSYSVTPDGQKFLVVEKAGPVRDARIDVMVGLADELRRKPGKQ